MMLRRRKLHAGILGGLVLAAAAALPAMANIPIPEVLLENHYEYEYDEAQGRMIGDENWQEIMLNEESASEYPQLAATLAKLNGELSDEMRERMDEMKALNETEDEFFPETGMSYSDSILLRRADDKVVTFLDYYTDYTGGAHGYYSYTGTSIDAADGHIITLEEVVRDQDQLRSAIKEQLQKLPDSEYFWDLDETLANYGSGEDAYAYAWVLETDGITIFFNPYEIAAYAAGMIHVHLSFQEYPELFTDTYGASTGAYVKELMRFYPEYLTLPGGERVQLSIDEEMESTDEGYADYSAYEGYHVTFGEQSLRVNNYFYYDRPLFVHLADGRNYLYVLLSADNDWQSIDVIDVSAGSPIYVGNFNGGLGVSYDDETYVSQNYLPVNTDCFRLDTRINLLSTYTGIRYYRVGEDGMPMPLDEEYYRDSSYEFSLSTSIDLDGTLPEDHFLPVTIPAGTQLAIVKTDGYSYVDFRQEDGTLVRLEVSGAHWPHQVNGIDEDQCFDVLYYAG